MDQFDTRKVATVPVRAKIGPSILNANLADLVNECERLSTKHAADYLHLDVMDGHFVPNLTFGHPLVKCLRDTLKERNCNPLFDMHMMVSHPEQWIESMHDAGADLYTFHLEATEPRNVTKDVIRKIREAGMQVGVGIKPNTPVEDVLSLVDQVDMVLIMTVEPGFGGQSFMANMMPKVEKLRQLFPDLNIEVDGGVGRKTIQAAADAGANLIVSGTGVVKAADPGAEIKYLRETTDASLNKIRASRNGN